jgi:hypothetical protein
MAELLRPAEPLNLRTREHLRSTPHLNVLIPGRAMHCMSGGPNTALNLGYRMAKEGVPVRFVATGVPPDARHGPLWDHVMQLSGIGERLAHVQIATAHDREQPLDVGANDVFFATAWWTAQMAKSALPSMRCKRFLYLIQDFEPGLHAFSTHYAMALETYDLDYYAMVNHRLLLDYLTEQRVGRFAETDFARRAAVLDPAIDRGRFHPEPREPGPGRTALFYARPHSAMRNLFELGAAALQVAVARGAFDACDWEFLGIGDPFDPVPLGGGREIRSLPWMSFDGYAARMRSSDLLLSPMLSPHPSYPPLEMAACGGVAVTNTFACKTAERLARISPNILAAPPTLEGLAEALAAAARRCAARDPLASEAPLDAPASWDESMGAVLPFALQAWRECTRG